MLSSIKKVWFHASLTILHNWFNFVSIVKQELQEVLNVLKFFGTLQPRILNYNLSSLPISFDHGNLNPKKQNYQIKWYDIKFLYILWYALVLISFERTAISLVYTNKKEKGFYSWFHEKGSWFNGDYIFFSECTGSWGNVFQEIPSIKTPSPNIVI